MADQQSSVFPVYIKAEYAGSGPAFAQLTADAKKSVTDVQRAFEQGYGQVSQIVSKALSVPRNKGGSLDLGVDDYRAAAKEADAYAIATREVANAMRFQAVNAGKLSKEDQAVAAAARMAAKEAEKQALELNALAKSAELTQQALNRQKSATDAVVAASGRGTTANQMMVNSTRAARTAQIQMGQQMQDVAISLYSGQRASVVLAQQLPQLAFAFTGAEGKVGKFATALSSGFGSIALVAGGAGLGLLIDMLMGTSEEADKAGSATSRLTDKLDLTKNSYESLIDVVKEYNKAQDKSTALTYDAIVAAEKKAQANLTLAETELANLKASKDVLTNPALGVGGSQFGTYSIAVSAVEDRIAELKKNLAETGLAAGNERIKRATDERYRIETDYVAKLATLEAKRLANIIDQNTYDKEGLRITQAKIAALKAYDESQRKTGSTGQYGREIGMAEAKSIAAKAGFKVNSGTRPTWIKDEVPGGASSQERLYNKWVAAGKPANNPTAKPGTSAHEKSNALDIAFASGVSAASLKKAYADEGVRLTKILKEAGHFHIEWSTKGADKAESEADRIAKALERAREQTDRFADSSSNSIARVTERWDDQPKLVDQANASIREMDRLLGNIEDRLVNDASLTDEQRGLLGGLIPQIEKAKTAISTFVDRDIAKWVDQSQQGMEIQKLLLSGYDDQAAVQAEINKRLEWAGKLNQDQIATITAQVLAEQELTREIERRQEIQSAYLDTTRSVRSEIESLFSGRGFDIKRMSQTFLDLQGRVLTERLFGDAFRELDKWVKKETGFDDAVGKLETQTYRASDAISALADAASGGAARISGGSGAADFGVSVGGVDRTISRWDQDFENLMRGIPANDDEIVVTGTRKANKGTINALSPTDYFMQMSKATTRGFENLVGAGPLSGALGGLITGTALGGKAGGALGLLSGLGLGKVSGFAGRALGGLSQGSMIGSVLGLDSTGSAAGGFVGDLLGIGGIGGGLIGGVLGGGNLKKKLIGAGIGGLAGGLLGGSLIGGLVAGGGSAMTGAATGAVLGPLGIIGGAIIGALISGIFKKTKYGAASISNGNIVKSSNNADYGAAANSAGGSIAETISRIAMQLGGTVGNYAVSIGQTNGNWNVNPNAINGKIGTKWQRDTIDFKKDQEGAVRWAILNAIQDGAVQGIRAGAQRILAAGNDIEAQVEKALKFQSIFDRLKAYEDPMGYALEKLDREFAELRRLTVEAGEGAVEVERLYGLERARVIEETNKKITASLRDLYDSLTEGNDARSLGERRAFALAKYDPLAARVAAGDKTAYDDFAAAAQSLLDIERQMFGSQSGYFTRLDEITNLTKTRIDAEANIASIAIAGGSQSIPTPSNDNVPVVNAIDAQTNAIIAIGNQTNAILSDLAARWNGTSGGGGGGGSPLLSYEQLF